MEGSNLRSATSGARSTGKTVLKGIAYGPMPAKTGAPVPKADDFMGDGSMFMWGPKGRNDLGIFQQMGANAVRLYGNDPRMDHSKFLDGAHEHGLEVIMGISDWPYIQMPFNCQKTGFNCFHNITDQFEQILAGGVLQNGNYHPAVKKFILINEPDLKFGQTDVENYIRVIVSAFDAVLWVEQQKGVGGDLPYFTTTFSYSTCEKCKSKYANKPALPNMDVLMSAMKDPSTINYKPQSSDLWSSYEKRFMNSFNTANLASDIQQQFLQYYDEIFPNTPAFIGEYHHARPGTNQTQDLQEIIKIAENPSNQLVGINFFEWQVRYDKGGSEMDFGMYGLGELNFGPVLELGAQFPSWCLTAQIDDLKENLPNAVTEAFGGKGVDQSKLCDANPLGVVLNGDGFNQTQGLKNTKGMATFIGRIVEHLGGSVNSDSGLQSFAALYSGENGKATASFDVMMNVINTDASFVDFDGEAECATDPDTPEIFLGDGIMAACGELGTKKLFNCSDVPDDCAKDARTQADYVFSIYYRKAAKSANPLVNCAFGIAGKFQVSTQFNKMCTVSGNALWTPLTAEGYDRIRHPISGPMAPGHVQDFVARLLKSMNGKVTDGNKGLAQLSAAPPTTFKELQAELAKAPWTCGAAFDQKVCPGGAVEPSEPDMPEPQPNTPSGGSDWWVWLLVILILLSLAGGAYLWRKKQVEKRQERLLRAQEQQLRI